MPFAFDGLWNLLTSPPVNWANRAFDKKKAYIMSLFSALAYEHVSKYEIDYRRRAKVIPCLAYQERLASFSTVDIEALKRRLEFAEVEIVESDYAVYIIIKVRDLIVIAVRGTVPIYYYDLHADLNIRKIDFYNGSRRGFFHKGFYDEAAATWPRLEAVLNRFGAFTGFPDKAPKIYITGHSLGAAIAAILFGLWVFDDEEGIRLHSPFNASQPYICYSAYVFAMPKFANAEVMQNFRKFYHVRNRHDPVPYLPPGFASDGTQEFVLSPYPNLHTDPVKKFAIIAWLWSVGRMRMLKNHGIETYWSKLATEIGINIPFGLLPPDQTFFQRIPLTHPRRS